MHAARLEELFRAFGSAVPTGGAAPSPADAQAARAALAQVMVAAEAAHGHLGVDHVRFATHVGRHAPAAPADWAAALGRIHAADLYLAFACAEQVPGALALFEQTCGASIDIALRGAATAEFTDDAKQLLREKLFVGDTKGDEAPRILSYAGRGPLAAWVAVSAQRTALSIRRHETSTRARHASAGREDLASAVHPELAYLKRRYRAAFVEAFEKALAAVTDRERTLMRLHLHERLRLDQIAPMFQVNTSTVSRWLTAARESILARTREELGNRLRVSPTEFASIARLVQSQIDVSLVRLLTGEPPKR